MTWVRDGIFAAGGEDVPEAWESFAAQTGITAILHLRPRTPQAFCGPLPASFLWLDVVDEDQASLTVRLLAGAFIEDCLTRGQRLLLHASLGRHRTRWALVAYRIWSGAAPEVAQREAARAPWLAPYRTDPTAWTRMAEFVRGRRSAETALSARTA